MPVLRSDAVHSSIVRQHFIWLSEDFRFTSLIGLLVINHKPIPCKPNGCQIEENFFPWVTVEIILYINIECNLTHTVNRVSLLCKRLR